MLQRQKLIFGIVIFFLAFSSIYVLDIVNFPDLYPNNTLSTSYPLEDISPTIGYNVLTDTEEIEYFSNSFEELSFQTIIPPYLGNNDYSNTLDIGNPEISYPFLPDDRVKINSTSSYPWSTICKLYITAADDTQWIGSGAMLDAYHVLTCGHCVYFHENGGWASEVEVVPGKDGSYRPFGVAYATYFRTYTEWTQFEMVQHDWAVITLDRTIGNQTGWMGRKTADLSDPIYTGTLHTAGYPGDLDLGEYMYYDSDVGQEVDEYNHWFWMDTAGGQSGGPVWEDDGGNYYILTVNAYEYEFGTYANLGTRLNQDKFDRINTWLAADTPPIDNPNGWDPSLTVIITVFTTIGIAVVVVGLVIALRRARKPDLALVEPYQNGITRYESVEEIRANAFGYCPMCGRTIFRDTQRFCSNCGHDLNIKF